MSVMGLAEEFGKGVGKVLWPLIEPRLQQLQDVLVQLLKDKLDEFIKKGLALIPLAVGSALKSGIEQTLGRIPGVQVPELNAEELAEFARGDLNKIPDIDIPVLSDIFDLTDFVKGLGR